MAYRTDALCSILVLPCEVITAILVLRSWFHLYLRPFDGLGILAYLRRASLLNDEQKQRVIQFVIRPVRGTYLISSELEPFTESACYDLSTTHSLEILGREAVSNRTFASSDLKGERHFAIDLQRVRLRVTHCTVSCHYRPEVYAGKLLLWGSNTAQLYTGPPPHPPVSLSHSTDSCWSQIILDPQPLEEIREPGRLVKTWRVDPELSKILKNDASFRYFRQFKVSVAKEAPQLVVQCLLSGIELYGWICLEDSK